MKKGYKYVLCVVGSIWAIAMVALSSQFVAAHRETRNALLAFDVYSSSLINQRFDQAYETCGTDFHSAMPYDKFVSVQKSLQSQFGLLKSVRKSAYHVYGSGTPILWKAAIDADLIYGEKTLRFQFVFHKERDRWLLFGSEQL